MEELLITTSKGGMDEGQEKENREKRTTRIQRIQISGKYEEALFHGFQRVRKQERQL
jgi:hypothetical protein